MLIGDALRAEWLSLFGKSEQALLSNPYLQWRYASSRSSLHHGFLIDGYKKAIALE